jgi:hypothetical protein
MVAERRIRAWIDWYRFARATLGEGHDESVAYANLRYVEETNRDTRRAAMRADPLRSPLPFRQESL